MTTSVQSETNSSAAVSAPVEVLLRDGRIAVVRGLRAADREGLLRLHLESGPDSRRLRFFGSGDAGPRAYAEHLIVGSDHLAAIATQGEAIIGVASAEFVPDPFSRGSDETSQLAAGAAPAASAGRAAEVAVVVADEWHHAGIGTLLLEHLAERARLAGVDRFVAEVMGANQSMLEVFRDLGYRLTLAVSRGVYSVTIDLAPTPAVAYALATRELEADAASIRAVLSPASVAVVGVGHPPEEIGRSVLANIVAGGFTGRVAAVSQSLRSAATVSGIAVYPSVAAVPEPVDLAVIAVPADQVIDALTDCGTAGVRAAIVLTSGFGESGDFGAEQRLRAHAHAHGIRLVGPNCLGVINADPAVRLNATFTALRSDPVHGPGVGLASQSGALGIGVLAAAHQRQLPISQFVSLGDKCDISGNDMLLSWLHDPEVSVAALYLESIGNPRRFRRIAAQASQRMPVVALRGGRSRARAQAGASASASATAAAATPDAVGSALFRDSGVISADRTEELLDLLQFLARQPVPAGQRIAVIGNSAGPAALTVDAVDVAGGTTAILNDLGTAAGPQEYTDAIRAARASGEVDAVIAIHTATRIHPPGRVLRAIEESAAGEVTAIPVAGVVLGVQPPSAGSLPWFRFPESAARTLVKVGSLGVWRGRSQIPLEAPVGAPIDWAAVSERVAAATPDPSGRIPSGDALGLLDLLGIQHREITPEAISEGLELFAGVSVPDPGIPIVVIGAGGLHQATVADRTLRTLPLDRDTAAEMVQDLRISALLPDSTHQAGRSAAQDVIERLALAGRFVPALAELEINPLIVTPMGATAVGVTCRVHRASERTVADPVNDCFTRSLDQH